MTTALTLATDLLTCLQTALLAGPNPPPENKIMLRAGGEVTPLLALGTDECCTGLGWVRIAGISGARTIDDPLIRCFTNERILTLELGVARCAPMGTVQDVPSEDDWTASATQLDADQGAMEEAICCAFAAVPELNGAVAAVGEYAPFGVDGNCIGGTMTVLMNYDACCIGS